MSPGQQTDVILSLFIGGEGLGSLALTVIPAGQVAFAALFNPTLTPCKTAARIAGFLDHSEHLFYSVNTEGVRGEQNADRISVPEWWH
jgi:hypothetical protein